MKQLFHCFSDGKIDLLEIPCPNIKEGHLLIKTKCSLLSTGTEKFLIDFGKSNILSKGIKQPERLKEVINKVKTDGLIETVDAVNSKLDQPIPLGYCNVGEVVEISSNISNFKVGDRVVSNGSHAEFVLVPENLCALIPPEVDNHQAAFCVISSIGLNGVRLANPTIGETFLVIGLGLIGLTTAQILLAQGCNVLGIDPDEDKCKIANKFGIETYDNSSKQEKDKWCFDRTNSMGVDATIITASTNSNEPIDLAAKSSRKRGRIILIGTTNINIKRDLFYKKELSFQVSCSYGPGRYDPSYEIKGNDYPIGFVRWTEQRNFQAILEIMKKKNLNTNDLISHTFDFENAIDAYELLLNGANYLGIVLDYDSNTSQKKEIIFSNHEIQKNTKRSNTNITVIGVGNYTRRTLLSNLKKLTDSKLYCLSSNNGTGTYFAKKFGFKKFSTDISAVIKDKNSDILIIATRHDSHAALVIEGLRKNKNIFVEKPLCLNKSELKEINIAYKNSKGKLIVGYNRRFSKLIQKLKKELSLLNGTKSFIYTCNAGFISNESWIQDPSIGGGRLLGEACHFVDLLKFLSDSNIASINITTAKSSAKISDIFTINILFENNSIGTIHYFSNGNKKVPKENLEVYSQGKIFKMINYKKLIIYDKKIRKTRLFKQDKGHLECLKLFIDSIKNNKNSPIPYEEIMEVQNAILKIS